MAAKPSEDPGRRARPDRDAARQRARQLPRHPRRHRERHGDAVLARRPHEHEGASRRRTSAARSWSCSRWASATTPRPTSTPAARVFTGWNLHAAGRRGRRHRSTTSSSTTPNQHDTTAKTFSFPIYPDGSKTIPARAAADGMQDGLDFIDGAGRASRTRRGIWRRSCTASSSAEFGDGQRDVRRTASRRLSAEPLRHEGGDARSAAVAASSGTTSAYFARYSWPVEFVVRALKDVGWTGFSVNDALTPLVEHGPDPLRAARRRRLGRRADAGSRPARCSRG